jgi:hypothetical protein
MRRWLIAKFQVIVRELLDFGADPEKRCKAGVSPIEVATTHCFFEIADLLQLALDALARKALDTAAVRIFAHSFSPDLKV